MYPQAQTVNLKDLDFLAQCRNSFIFFCENVINLEMSPYHKELALLPMQHRYLCIVVPTGHSKTSLYAIAYPLWRLWREKNIEICLVSSALDQSMKIFSKAQTILESNPFFSNLLPRNRLQSWNKSELSTTNGNQFYIKPFNSTARGIHPHYLIFDDLLRESDTPMDQIKETFWSVFYPRGQIYNAQHIVVGTPFSVDDLYVDLEKDPQWKVIRKSAVVEDESGRWTYPLWPERFSLGTLKKIQESMGTLRFAREYLCKPSSASDMLFPTEMVLNCLDDNLESSYSSEGLTYIGADFAMSAKESGDFNVFTVVDVLPKEHVKNTKEGPVKIENPIVIRRIMRFRGAQGHIENLKSLSNYFHPQKIIADNSGVGAKFVPELRENQLTVDAQDFRPANRNMMLMNLRRLIEQGRLVIPYKGESIPLMNRLMRELSGFRLAKTKAGTETWQSIYDHDDTVFSLALAVKDVAVPRKIMQNLFFGSRI